MKNTTDGLTVRCPEQLYSKLFWLAKKRRLEPCDLLLEALELYLQPEPEPLSPQARAIVDRLEASMADEFLPEQSVAASSLTRQFLRSNLGHPG